MTTVGYGDLQVQDPLGKLLAMLAVFVGVILMSLTVVVLWDRLQFNDEEKDLVAAAMGTSHVGLWRSKSEDEQQQVEGVVNRTSDNATCNVQLERRLLAIETNQQEILRRLTEMTNMLQMKQR